MDVARAAWLAAMLPSQACSDLVCVKPGFDAPSTPRENEAVVLGTPRTSPQITLQRSNRVGFIYPLRDY